MPASNMAPHPEALKVDGSLIGWLLQIIVALLEEVQALRAKLAVGEKDSTTSHKPPSSDGFKPALPQAREKTRRPQTRFLGQKARWAKRPSWHHPALRDNVLPCEVTETIPHKPQSCEQCHAPLTEQNPSTPVERRQVWELPEIKPLVQEHVFYQTTCDCGHPNRLPVPEWIYSGMGENLQAHVAYFTAEAKLARRTLRWHYHL